MDKYNQSKKRLLETEFYQLKQKQALCDSLINLLTSRAELLQDISGDLDKAKECLSSVANDLRTFIDELQQDAPRNVCERLEESRSKLDECEESLKEEVNNISDFLKDHLMMCEEISSDIESISQKIHDVQQEHQETPDHASNGQGTNNDSD